MITLRSAREADAELLLGWANDPVTRAAGFHRRPIDAATHARWLSERLADPRSRLFIGLDEHDRPVGQVRLDAGPDGRAEVSISVAHEARGRGVGLELLRAGLEAGRADGSLRVDVYVARIRPQNVASIRLFERVGFLHVGSEDVAGEEALVYELPAG